MPDDETSVSAPAGYTEFTAALTRTLEGDGRVLGLVALGSMAAVDTLPDRFSDHDFFVVARDAEPLRRDLGWLPRPGDVLFSFRETAHGVKVVYRDGGLLEFAVFTPDELRLARVNRYRVLLDRERIAGRMAEVAAATRRDGSASAPGDPYLFGQLLTRLLVGVRRHARGEELSAHALVKREALTDLIVLLERHVPAPGRALLDDLDPLRRFERVYPALGREIGAILSRPTPAAACGLLDVAARELAGVPSYPEAAVAVLRPLLEAP